MRTPHRAGLILGTLLLTALSACSLGGGGGDPEGDELDPSESTNFRTITVDIVTSAPPVTDSAGSVVVGAGTGTQGGYTVESGDYWYGIASKLGVDIQALLDANGATTDTLITPGQVLVVPAGATGAAGGTTPATVATATTSNSATDGSQGTYQIQSGDCWACIAEKLGVTLDALLSANGATADTVLIPGEFIRVPTTG
jgi:LysM repeat protein